MYIPSTCKLNSCVFHITSFKISSFHKLIKPHGHNWIRGFPMTFSCLRLVCVRKSFYKSVFNHLLKLNHKNWNKHFCESRQNKIHSHYVLKFYVKPKPIFWPCKCWNEHRPKKTLKNSFKKISISTFFLYKKLNNGYVYKHTFIHT